MADDAFNQNQWPDKDKGQSPSQPPKPDVDVRTFDSDVKSTAQSGGGAPKPYTPPTPPPPKPAQEPKPVEEPKQSFGQVFPSASSKGDGGEPQSEQKEPSPTPMNFDAAGLEAEGMKPKKSPKGLFIGILVLIIVVGLVALGYFFIYPVFFGSPGEVAEVAPPAPSEPSQPEVPVVPQVPVVTEEEETTAPEEESGETAEPETPAPPAVTEHNSLFTTAADVSGDVTLSSISVTAYKDSLEFATAEVSVLKEVVFRTGEGEFVSFDDLLGVLLPTVFTGELNQSFEPDFTLFTYTDSNGTWPGFVAQLGEGATLADVQSGVSALENSANLANLYLASPGTEGSWGSGSVEGVSNRYLPFSQSGASLNYGWKGNLLVVSTSFPGFREALQRLE
jgi:cytoskeletal protein RodZ